MFGEYFFMKNNCNELLKEQNYTVNYNENIKKYNENYNINYFNNNLYKTIDTDYFKNVIAEVIDNQEKINTTVNDINVDLYKTKILYTVDNYFFNEKTPIDIELKTYNSLLVIPSISKNIINDNKINIKCEILTSKQLDKGDSIDCLYMINENGGRIAPPFLKENFITYFENK